MPVSPFPPISNFLHPLETWACLGDSQSGLSEWFRALQSPQFPLVSYKHQFRNRSNTTDFYYQQRFNSADANDALTVHQFLLTENPDSSATPWNLHTVVEMFQLGNLLNEEIIKLSNGETRRLLIAAALVNNPKCLLLDHPLTGLDHQTRSVFNGWLLAIRASGISVIIATSPDEIPDPVTHVAVVNNNSLAYQGPKSGFRLSDVDFYRPLPVDAKLLQELLSNHPPPSPDPIIKMTNVTVQYDHKIILDNIQWLVNKGERWSLSGPNGAGKSTLLSLVNADNPQAYANDIVLFGRQRGSGESIWDIKKQTGFVSPELYQYFPTDSSCLHVIESGFYDTVGLFRPADSKKEEICCKWMQLLRIDKYARQLFSRVPINVQRLCLLARALVKNPALLILDEPTQGLDPSEQQFFTRLIDDICRQSTVTIVYVTHYEQHIPAAVNKYLRLEKGKMVGNRY